MHVSIFAIAGKPAPWLAQAEKDLIKRLPRAWRFECALLPPSRKTGDAAQRQADEWQRLSKRVHDGDRIVLLDERGTMGSSREFAGRLNQYRDRGDNLALIIGGADGFGDEARSKAAELWSLSKMTFPHELARLVLVEQLYRAHTIMEGHPYHRD